MTGFGSLGVFALGQFTSESVGGGGGPDPEPEPEDTTEYNLTFSLLSSPSFLDWSGATGSASSFESYLKTYFIIPDDTMTEMQSPYIYVFLDKGSQNDLISTEESVVDSNGVQVANSDTSLLFNAIWDWSESEDEDDPKVSRDTQVYRFRNGYSNSVSKNKIRGSGKTLQLLFRSEEGKAFDLLGWASWISKNSGY